MGVRTNMKQLAAPVKANLYLDGDVMEAITAIAAKEDRSPSYIIRRLLRQGLKGERK